VDKVVVAKVVFMFLIREELLVKPIRVVVLVEVVSHNLQ
jgi:hypothetical protein